MDWAHEQRLVSPTALVLASPHPPASGGQWDEVESARGRTSDPTTITMYYAPTFRDIIVYLPLCRSVDSIHCNGHRVASSVVYYIVDGDPHFYYTTYVLFRLVCLFLTGQIPVPTWSAPGSLSTTRGPVSLPPPTPRTLAPMRLRGFFAGTRGSHLSPCYCCHCFAHLTTHALVAM
jgi:hypothetical protein